MQTKDAIRAAMDISFMVFKGYIGDLDDAEMMCRPGKGCNHLAWQCGHLISSEVSLLEDICPGKAAELPSGFAEKHSKESAGSDDASQFLKKDEYLEWMDKVRASTLAALDGMSDEALDAASPEKFAQFCPTLGHMFMLIGTHFMMHAGQIVPVRRQLDKPVLF